MKTDLHHLNQVNRAALYIAHLALTISLILGTIPSQALAGVAIGCDPSTLPASLEQDPYASCQDPEAKVVFERYFNACLKNEKAEAVMDRAYAMARLEQLNLIFDQEIFYVSRIPYTSGIFRTAWNDLRARWKVRAQTDQFLFKIDADPRMGPNKCRLSWSLGMDCGGQPGIDMIGLKQRQAMAAADNEAASFKIKPSLVLNLVKAQLMIEGANYKNTNIAGDKKVLKKANDEKKVAMKDFVFAYYPELSYFFDNDLKQFLNIIIRNNDLKSDLFAEINESRTVVGKAPLIGLVNLVLKKHTPTMSGLDSASDYNAMMATNGFVLTYNKILDNFDHQIKQARSDRGWTLNQDYLLGNAMDSARAVNDFKRSAIYQDIICENLYRHDRNEKIKDTAIMVGGGIALLTGVGAMFDLGALITTGLVSTSLVIVNSMSAYDLLDAARSQAKARELFLLRGSAFQDMSDANKEMLQSIPWVIINAAMISPAFLLEKIGTAKNLARAANDVEKVKKLERYRKAVTAMSLSLNAGIAVYSTHSSYLAVKDIIAEAKADAKDKAKK